MTHAMFGRGFLHWIIIFVLLPILFDTDEAQGAAVEQNWSTVMALYGETGGDRGAGLESQSFTGPSKPEQGVVPGPDGRPHSLLQILELAREELPDLALWEDPELQEAMSGDRWLGSFFKWIKDHVKFSLDTFGLHLQFLGDNYCGQITAQFWGDVWSFTWEPCP